MCIYLLQQSLYESIYQLQERDRLLKEWDEALQRSGENDYKDLNRQYLGKGRCKTLLIYLEKAEGNTRLFIILLKRNASEKRPGPFLPIFTFSLGHGSQIHNLVSFIASPNCHFLFSALPSLLKNSLSPSAVCIMYCIWCSCLVPGTVQNIVHALLCTWAPRSCLFKN